MNTKQPLSTEPIKVTPANLPRTNQISYTAEINCYNKDTQENIVERESLEMSKPECCCINQIETSGAYNQCALVEE
jgi:hypothetical protein